MRLFRRSITRAKANIWNSLLVMLLAIWAGRAACAASETPWQAAAANLAEQIAGTLRTGPVRLTLQNISSISTEDVPVIRLAIEQALRSHGVALTSDANSPTISVTLSENGRERLWIAEIARNGDTKIVMVRLAAAANQPATSETELILHRQVILATNEPVLAGVEIPGGFVALEPDQFVFFSTPNGTRIASDNIPQGHPVSRDPRGILLPASQSTFSAWLPGVQCNGSYPDPQSGTEWKVQCNKSDDPWPIVAAGGDSSTPGWKAFYNSTRDFFTGVVVPAQPIELPPFYTASLIPRPGQETALLLTSTDNRVMLMEKGQLRAVTGTQDWGSDFAELQTGCGPGTQTVVSASGPGASDRLRAYNISDTNAVPASVPVPMSGSVVSIWAAPDGKSVYASVRHPGDSTTQESYEVDRVTASCN